MKEFPYFIAAALAMTSTHYLSDFSAGVFIGAVLMAGCLIVLIDWATRD